MAFPDFVGREFQRANCLIILWLLLNIRLLSSSLKNARALKNTKRIKRTGNRIVRAED